MIRPVLGLAILASAAGFAAASVDVSRDSRTGQRPAKADRLALVSQAPAAAEPAARSAIVRESGDVLLVRDSRGRDLVRIDRVLGVTTIAKGTGHGPAAPAASEAVVEGDACGAEGPCPAESGA